MCNGHQGISSKQLSSINQVFSINTHDVHRFQYYLLGRKKKEDEKEKEKFIVAFDDIENSWNSMR